MSLCPSNLCSSWIFPPCFKYSTDTDSQVERVLQTHYGVSQDYLGPPKSNVVQLLTLLQGDYEHQKTTVHKE